MHYLLLGVKQNYHAHAFRFKHVLKISKLELLMNDLLVFHHSRSVAYMVCAVISFCWNVWKKNVLKYTSYHYNKMAEVIENISYGKTGSTSFTWNNSGPVWEDTTRKLECITIVSRVQLQHDKLSCLSLNTYHYKAFVVSSLMHMHHAL